MTVGVEQHRQHSGRLVAMWEEHQLTRDLHALKNAQIAVREVERWKVIRARSVVQFVTKRGKGPLLLLVSSMMDASGVKMLLPSTSGPSGLCVANE